MPSLNAVLIQKLRLMLGALLIFAGASRVARAQGTTLHATVADANTGDYILDASVSVDPVGLNGTTDFFGDARFASLKKGRYTVHARRIGYAPNDVEVQLSGRDSVEVTMLMTPLTYQLASVTIEEPLFSAGLKEFEARRKKGLGYFITDSTIRNSQGMGMASLVRSHFPGISYGGFSTRGPNHARSLVCNFDTYWNGVRIGRGFPAISLDQIGGIEFYNPGFVPVQYKWPGSDCGVMLFWSRPN
jgi:hypothetical protein